LEYKLRLVEVLLAEQGGRVRAIHAAVTSLLCLETVKIAPIRGRAADADGHDLAVANAELAVVFGIEVVGEADVLGACGIRGHRDPGEEDDTVTVAKIGIAAGEILSLQLLPGKHAHIPLVVLERVGAVLDSSCVDVAVFVGSDEVEVKVTTLRAAGGDIEDKGENRGENRNEGDGSRKG
jgi:hypothetical protein